MHNADLAAYGLVPYGVKGLDGGDFREQAGPIVKDASDQSEIERAQQLLDQGLEEIGKTKEDMQDGFSIQCLGKRQSSGSGYPEYVENKPWYRDACKRS